MAINDYRYDPFNNTFNVKAIYNEQHTIPKNSPYTIRLNEVPQKTSPTTMQVKFSNGTSLTEVSAEPSQGQYWPDYLTFEHGIDDWNTGTLKFNSSDAGKVVKVTYNGLGTLTDDRLLNQVEVTVTSSTQPERDAIVDEVTSYDKQIHTGIARAYNKYSGETTITTYRGRIKTHRGLGAGTYTLQRILQHLVNLSHTQEYQRDEYTRNCNCNCNCDCGDDSGGP